MRNDGPPERVEIVIRKLEFVNLMRFPPEWDAWGMYPQELFELQLSTYEPGNEDSSEHHRNGAFHWWLRKNPSSEAIGKLIDLTYLDPDPHLGDDVRNHIRSSHGRQ